MHATGCRPDVPLTCLYYSAVRLHPLLNSLHPAAPSHRDLTARQAWRARGSAATFHPTPTLTPTPAPGPLTHLSRWSYPAPHSIAAACLHADRQACQGRGAQGSAAVPWLLQQARGGRQRRLAGAVPRGAALRASRRPLPAAAGQPDARRQQPPTGSGRGGRAGVGRRRGWAGCRRGQLWRRCVC